MESSTILRGFRALITRPEERCEALRDAIFLAGGKLLTVASIQITEPDDLPLLKQIFDTLDQFDLAIFVSRTAVDHGMLEWQSYRNSEHQDALLFATRIANRLPLLAIGPGTSAELKRYHLTVHAEPKDHFSTEGLLALPILQNTAGKRILIFCAAGGRMDLAATLRERGAHVTSAYTYARRCPERDLSAECRLWRQEGLDLVIATSCDSLVNLLSMAASNAAWLKQRPWLVVSQRVAAMTKALGFSSPPIVALNATNSAIFDALCFARSSERL